MPNKEKDYRHLDFERRCLIEKYLNAGMGLSWIAQEIGVPLSTISREVCRNRRDDGHTKTKRVMTVCKHRRNCAVRALCKERHCRRRRCASCDVVLCSNICGYYEAEVCKRTERAPYVCNGCIKPFGCMLHRYRYEAKCAQRMADVRLKETRQGVNSTEEEFAAIIAIVRPLLKAGIGLDAIWCEHKDELGISKRTLYRWAEAGYGLCNMDLPKKVSYRPRKQTKSTVPRRDLSGRAYSDFMALEEDVRASAFEMDCLEGKKTDRQVILTLFHRRTHLQAGILLKEHTSACVVEALDWVESICEGRFADLFSVILTDRGHEFSDIDGMEMRKDGTKRCSVYFCDPQRPSQKGGCERAHVDVRKVLVKGKAAFDSLTPWKVAKLFSHINSLPRPSLGGTSPLALARAVFPKEFFDQMGLRLVPLNEINLKPDLMADEDKED